MRSLKCITFPLIMVSLISISSQSNIGIYTYKPETTIIQRNSYEVNNENVKLVNEKCSEINKYVLSQVNCIGNMTKDLSKRNNFKTKFLEQYFKKAMKNNLIYSDIYIGLSNKKIIAGSGWIAPVEYNCTERIWYKEASKSKTFYIDAYNDIVVKKTIFTIAKPIKVKDKLVGVVSADVYGDYINKVIELDGSKSKGDTIVILNENGETIFGNSRIKVSQSDVKRLFENISGTLDIKLQSGMEKKCIYNTIESTGWKVILLQK